MDWDDEDADDRPARPLLPPDDRIWRHPSEIGHQERDARPPGPSAGDPARRARPLPAIVALTAAVSALITLAVVAVVQPGPEPEAVFESPPVGETVSSVRVIDVTGVAERLRPSIARVEGSIDGEVVGGAGVIFSYDGLMLTMRHLVEGAESLEFLLADGRRVGGRVVGTDPFTSLALVDLDGEGYRAAPLSDSDELRAGLTTIAIGRSGGGKLEPVVAVGVVSAIEQEVWANDGKLHLLGMIQTDRALAPGCNGGALADASGEVIGIAATNATADGGTFGYAAPISQARRVADHLLERGRVVHGWLGIGVSAVDTPRAVQLRVPGGVEVVDVVRGSPAAAAGVRQGDVIVGVDEDPVGSASDLRVALWERDPGRRVTIHAVRGPERKQLTAVLAERPPASTAS